MKKYFRPFLWGVAMGGVNGLLGTGGGMVGVPILASMGLSPKESHATCIALIYPITFISALFYLWNGSIALSSLYPFLPGGIIGAAVGSLLLPKVNSRWLVKGFGVLMIITAIWLVV